jgi:tRNA(adenine34) deaminase
MEHALMLAEQAMQCGEPPFGALLVDSTGAVMAECTDQVILRSDLTRHAEINVVHLACGKFGPDLAGSTLYTTVEPCPMCFTAAWLANVSRVVFGCSMDAVHSATAGQQRELRLAASIVNAQSAEPLELLGGVLASRCASLFQLTG